MKRNLGYGIVMGNRIPMDFFVTMGTGESDITVHAGSYHLALKAAGIEKANIMTYSSILPGIAKKVNKPSEYVHGEVMECIMAVSSCFVGENATAGIIYGWLKDEKGERYGGLVCEHNGNYSRDEIESKLRMSLNELYINGFQHLEMEEPELTICSFTPQKQYGTALVSLCFTNYFIPLE